MQVLEPIKCAACASLFVPSNPKQIYCSTNCRVKSHQAKKKEEEKINSEIFEDLKSKPKHIIETSKELNKDWVILNSNLENLLGDKSKLELQKQALILKSEKILKGNQGLIAGLSAAVIMGSILLYGLNSGDEKNKKDVPEQEKLKDSGNKKSGPERIILGLILTLVISGLAYVLGSEYGKKVNEKDAKILSKVNDIVKEIEKVKTKIDAIDIQSTIIKEDLKLIPRYLKETKIESIIKS